MRCPLRLSAGVVMAFGLVFSATDARADYKESYRRGMEAIDHGNWAEAARRMSEALAEQPREGEQVKLYGMRFEAYLPHYYRGLALFNAGDCDGALLAWNASEAQGAVKGANQYKTLLKNKQTCQGKVAKAKPSEKPSGPDPAEVARAVQGAEAEIARAEEASRAVATLAASSELSRSWASDAALGGAEKAARDLLASAQGRLEAGRKKPDLAVLGEARDLASRAAQQLEVVRSQAATRREAALRAANANKKTAESLPSPEVRTSPAAGGPSADLLAGARAYFDGDYRHAAELLARVSPSGGRAGAQALLLRSAARFALYVVGGQQDESLRVAAEADVQACRRLDPALSPHSDYFSPRFRDFFSAAR